MLLKEIADTFNFFREEGYEIYLALSENFPKEIREELSEFALNSECENDVKSLLILYEDNKIAEISIVGAKDRLLCLSIPLKYMLYRLYEESRKTILPANEHDIYSRAIQYINEHLTEDISVADVAKHINYSESYFGYVFKKKYKISVPQYIRELRLAKSKDLLKNTSFSITSVASCVGFDNSNYFSSIFKKYFGISPKEYRKNCNKIVK